MSITEKLKKPLVTEYVILMAAVILVGVSIYIRIAFRAVVTSDLDFHILPWYHKLQKMGILVGLGKDFYNYTPPYLYLLALATLTSRFISAVTAVKLISTVFDIYESFVIYKIARLKFQQGYLPHLAAAVFFCAPTIIANTGVWGQADSIYTAFLLTCVYFLLLERPLEAVFFFSIAFAFKPQAIFLVPFLLILTLKKKIPWYCYFLIPVVYLLAMWPAVALGRTWNEVLTIYASQADSGKSLTHNAPTLYVFFPKYAIALFRPAVYLASVAILVWVVLTRLFTRRMDRPAMLLLALISVTLTPFFLPNMHNRYFYPADAISVALAFTIPELWFVPILFQVISGLSYSVYLLAAPSENVFVAGILNLLTLVFLLWKQASMGRMPKNEVGLGTSVSQQAAD